MLHRVLLLLPLLAVPVAATATAPASGGGASPPGGDDGVCLLSHRVFKEKKLVAAATTISERSDGSGGGSRADSEEEALLKSQTLLTQLTSWRAKHEAVEAATNSSQGLIDQFIAASAGSDDACSARLLEAKRVLDGITTKAQELGTQIAGYERTLETETEALNFTRGTIVSLRAQYAIEEQQCHELQSAIHEVDRYESELEELRQMADPARRGNLDRLTAVPRAYEVETGKHCGGQTINSWSDGSNAHYGRTDLGVAECQTECDMHPGECAGFVLRAHDQGCFWKSGSLSPTPRAGHDCYRAVEPPAATSGGSGAASLLQENKGVVSRHTQELRAASPSSTPPSINLADPEQCKSYLAFRKKRAEGPKMPATTQGGTKEQQPALLLQQPQDQTQAPPQDQQTQAPAQDQTQAPAPVDCAEHREQLQQEYNEAYRELSVKKKEAQDRYDSYQDCLDDVAARLNGELAPLISQEDGCVERSAAAQSAIALYSPTLQLLRARLDKLRAHVAGLDTSCQDSAQVSEHLARVRDLIDSLAECPGQDSWKIRLSGDTGIPDFGDVSIFKIALPRGQRCTGALIDQACEAEGMTPLCGHANWGPATGCWRAPNSYGDPPKNYGSHHFSLPSHNTAVGLDINKLVGVCFRGNGASGAIYNAGNTHRWANSNGNLHRPDGEPGPEGRTTWSAQDQDAAGWSAACANTPAPNFL